MISSEEIDDLFRCLLAGVARPAEDQQLRVEQSRQLMHAFDRIEDTELRQELIVLIEIVAKMPDALRRKSRKVGGPALAHLH